jgi:hypothetical protein
MADQSSTKVMNGASAQGNGDRPLRPSRLLRIGISGHRLQSGRPFDVGAVERALVRVFTDAENWLAGAQSTAFDSSNAILTLVSALADGPDQMAVSAFTGRPPVDSLRRVEVVLPFAIDDYARTFRHTEDAERMRQQFAAADSTLSLADWREPDDLTQSPFAEHWRDQRYTSVGNLIVRQSDLLVAVWDQMPGAGPGGTAYVVAEAIAQNMAVVCIHPETGDIHLMTRYRFNRETVPGEGTSLVIAELGDADEEDMISNDLFLSFESLSKTYGYERLSRILDDEILPPEEALPVQPDGLTCYLTREKVRSKTSVGLYNLLFSVPARRHLQAQTSDKKPGFGIPALSVTANHVESSLKSDGWRKLYDLIPTSGLFTDFAKAWSRADAIATRLAHHYRSSYVAIFCLATLATVAGLTGSPMMELGMSETWFAATELSILCVALLIYWRGRNAHQHRRWLNAREISEQMRAHWALGLLGLGGRRVVGRQNSWTAWLFNAYAANVGLPHMTADVSRLVAIARVVQTEIVRDQASYHHRNEKILDFNHHKLERIGHMSLIFAMASSCALIVYLWAEHEFHWVNDLLRLSLLAISAGLPVVGAAATGIRYQGDFERFARRSEQTSAALNRIDRQLEQFITSAEESEGQKPCYERLRDIILHLEQVLLSDLDDWRFVYEARPDPGVG